MPGDRFGFDYLYQCVVDVINMEGLPASLETMTTARLRSIIEGERSRLLRVADWNRRQSGTAIS